MHLNELSGFRGEGHSYVKNNPLSFTDPSGFSWWTKWRKPIAAIAVAAIGAYYLAPMLGNYFSAAAFAAEGTEAAAAAGYTFGKGVGAVASGFASGGIGGGNIESAVAGAVSAGAFLAAGSLAETATGSFAGFGTGEPGRIALHAIAGCASGASAGGSCGKQAAAGAFSELAGPIIAAGGDQFAYRVTAHSIAGGLGSILAGGKFENGAITGAFGYLFNHCAHGSCTSDFEQFMYDWWPGYKAGTLIHNQLLGDKSWTGWEVLDAAAVGSGIAGRGLQLLSSTSRLAGLGYDANKLNHIFGNADHLMGPLLQQTGSTERAMLAIDRAAQPLVSNPAALQAGTWINVQGNQVWVRGVVINDRVRIGTASMNAGR